MKTIIWILLVGFLGFFGCSGGNDGTTVTVGQATPVAPFGIIETPTPTYEWTPVRWATKYRLVVQETSQESTIQDTTETYVIDEWYAAEEAGCASEDGFCMVTPDIEVFEENTWKVLACANDECGLWSGPINFDFTAMNGPRFTDNGDNTVTDNHTGLMWTKNTQVCHKKNWFRCGECTASLRLASYSDWRLPSLTELWSLVDKDQYDPALPPGHPFVNVSESEGASIFWTSTPYDHASNPGWYAWAIYLPDGIEMMRQNTDHAYAVWPVRTNH